MSNERTIALFNRGDSVRKEFTADGVIKPGQRVALQASGKVKAAGTAGAKSANYHAIEDMYQGKGVSDSYADGELVQVIVGASGDRLQVLVKAAEVLTTGDRLEQTATGTYQKLTTGEPLAMALETITIGAEDGFALVEVI